MARMARMAQALYADVLSPCDSKCLLASQRHLSLFCSNLKSAASMQQAAGSSVYLIITAAVLGRAVLQP